MMLSWDQAAVLALLLAFEGVLMRPAGRRWLVVATAVCRETSLVLALFSVWQLAGRLSLMQLNGARGHALWLWHVERVLHLPSEITLQRVFLPYPLIIKAFNVYYAMMHFPALIVFLIWMFARHREHYPSVRNTVAILTAACLLIQLIPVAPPRMFADLGFVDTAIRYGQSVYGVVGSGFADQLSAMPSVHVAWSVLVALGVIVFSTSRRRWWIVAHPILTVLAVVATGNHWWFDGIVAVWLIGLAIVVERSLHFVFLTFHSRVARADYPILPEVVRERVG
jgi:PAP2 superfamily protein